MSTLITADVHGCGLELQDLIRKAGVNKENDQLVILGDIFDRGRHGHIVWEIIQSWGKKCFCIQGNHERKMLKFVNGERKSLPVHYYWTLDNMVNNGIKIEEIWGFLNSLPSMLFYNRGEIVKHINIGKERVYVYAATGDPLLLIDSLWNDYATKILVHAGVNVADVYDDLERYTVYGDFKDIPWWDRYKGNNVVIYGHLGEIDHSVRIRKNDSGVINSIGIDTGCATGGRLTGYLVEEDRYVHVDCRENWYAGLKQELGSSDKFLTPNGNITFPTGKVIQEIMKKFL